MSYERSGGSRDNSLYLAMFNVKVIRVDGRLLISAMIWNSWCGMYCSQFRNRFSSLKYSSPKVYADCSYDGTKLLLTFLKYLRFTSFSNRMW